MDHRNNGRGLGTLIAPQRNNYFYGKLMDVAHFEMEQAYVNRKRWLLNRLGLGEGVLCGLDVTAKDGQICISQGVAIDALGREIIVPATMCIDPWQLTDESGRPSKDKLSDTEAHTVCICLAYRECAADYMPVMVTDCNTREDCASGSTVESFRLSVRECVPQTTAAPAETGLPQQVSNPCGLPAPTALDHELCSGLVRTGTDLTWLDRHRLLCETLSGSCGVPDEQSCIPLATVELSVDGTIGNIDTCTYRRVVYSNAVLLDLIMCLAERIEECCGPTPPPTTPPPTTPPPATPPPGTPIPITLQPITLPPPRTLPPTTPPPTTPPPTTPPPTTAPPTTRPPRTRPPITFPPTTLPPTETLKVSEIEFMDTIVGVVRGTLGSGRGIFKRSTEPINAIRVTFINKLVDKSSATLSTFLVETLITGGPHSVPGTIIPDPDPGKNRTAFVVTGDSPDQKFFAVGDYQVTLFGDNDPVTGNTIVAMDSSRLDGEPVGLPSGEGTEGGNFVFKFKIEP